MSSASNVEAQMSNVNAEIEDLKRQAADIDLQSSRVAQRYILWFMCVYIYVYIEEEWFHVYPIYPSHPLSPP